LNYTRKLASLYRNPENYSILLAQ